VMIFSLTRRSPSLCDISCNRSWNEFSSSAPCLEEAGGQPLNSWEKLE
jgi:hypothetical protein